MTHSRNGSPSNGQRPAGSALGALRYPEYRKYWVSTLSCVIGFQMMNFALLWLVRQLEADPIWLGMVGLATGVPAIALNIFGGVLADRVDPRRLVLVSQVFTGALTLLLATLVFTGVVQIWHIILIAFFSGATQAFDGPARMAFFPHLIDRGDMMNAVALNSSIWQSTRMIAPMLAGALISLFGTSATLYVAAGGLVLGIGILLMLRVPPIPTRSAANLNAIAEGANYVKSNKLFSSLIASTFFNSFFGMAYLQLMPTFTVDVLHKGAGAQGFLVSAGGVGALLGTVTAAFLGKFHQRGLLILAGSVLFGGMIMLFALSSWYALSAVALLLAGYCQSVYMISTMSTLQMRVPDHLRGRVMGIFSMTYNLMPLGGMLAGVVASVASAPFAVASGGGAVSGFAVLNAAFNKTFRGLRPESERTAHGAAAAPARTAGPRA
jgi:MFS family permease